MRIAREPARTEVAAAELVWKRNTAWCPCFPRSYYAFGSRTKLAIACEAYRRGKRM